MAWKHVWRYTLRLFHTFVIFEKIRKIDAKREAQSHHFWAPFSINCSILFENDESAK